MPVGGSGPRTLGAFLPAAISRRLAAYLGEADRLKAVWQQCVSPPLVHHSLAVAHARGVLEVRVDSAAWATRLRLMQTELLARIRAVPGFETLHDLKVRIEPGAVVPPPEATARPAAGAVRRPAGGVGRLLTMLAADVGEPTLKTALERLGRTLDSAGKSRRGK
jgi:hypothetical protein